MNTDAKSKRRLVYLVLLIIAVIIPLILLFWPCTSAPLNCSQVATIIMMVITAIYGSSYYTVICSLYEKWAKPDTSTINYFTIMVWTIATLCTFSLFLRCFVPSCKPFLDYIGSLFPIAVISSFFISLIRKMDDKINKRLSK